jgi:REP element-mobilizing transposase RayT
MIYHVLNRGNGRRHRGNGRRRVFRKAGDYEAFERVLAEGLNRYAVDLLTYCLMPNHWHLVVRPRTDDSLGRWMRWVGVRSRNWVARVNRGLNDEQLEAVRTCVARGRPFGSASWVQRIAARLGLEFTLHGPGRPRKLSPNQ